MFWRLLLLLIFLSCSAGALAGSAGAQPNRTQVLRVIAERILDFQTSDGSIAMDPIDPPRETRIIPYFANFAARGLVEAYSVDRSARFLESARRWAAWYETHMNADGTIDDFIGRPGNWKPTGDCDSTDSYAGTYLELLWRIQGVLPDTEWTRARLPAIRKAVDAIRLTLQPNGLTLAKPKWPVMYTMDNTETALGLRAAEKLGRVLRNRSLEQESAALADRMERSVQANLWDAERQSYIVGLQTDGYRHRGLEKWYPDIMANLMAVAWLPAPSRNGPLFGRLKARFGDGIPRRAASRDEIDRLVWWGLAAQGARDHALGARICDSLVASAPTLTSIASPEELGHICRLLSIEWRRGSIASRFEQ